MKGRAGSEKERRHDSRRVRTVRRISSSGRTRLTVYRSLKHIYAQLIDSESGRTIATVSSRSKAVIGDEPLAGKIDAAKRVGRSIAKIAREKQIEEVVFNRNGFLYHGRVKALADAAREAGLRF